MMKYFGVGVKENVVPKLKHKHNGSIYPAKPKIKYTVEIRKDVNKRTSMLQVFYTECVIESFHSTTAYDVLNMCDMYLATVIAESDNIESWQKLLKQEDVKMTYKEIK